MSFVVRSLHLLSVSFLLGGAVLILLVLLAYGSRAREQGRLTLSIMQGYEWGFWGAAGLTVMTGIGNLGAFGDFLPDTSTAWGSTLVIKLSLVLGLLFLSALRSLSLLLVSSSGVEALSLQGLRLFRAMYGGTALYVAGVIALAVHLAHY